MIAHQSSVNFSAGDLDFSANDLIRLQRRHPELVKLLPPQTCSVTVTIRPDEATMLTIRSIATAEILRTLTPFLVAHEVESTGGQP
jgi:hypothetical protein